MTTPFPEDAEHAAYDRDAVERFWRILDWTRRGARGVRRLVLRQDKPRAPVLALASTSRVTRFGGRRAPALPDADPVTREAYTHEVISFGFWAGDQNVREPTYYSYTAPEPAGLRDQPL